MSNPIDTPPLLYRYFYPAVGLVFSLLIWSSCMDSNRNREDIRNTSRISAKVDSLISLMTLEEKIGQMSQVNGPGPNFKEDFRKALQDGKIGSLLNEVGIETRNELQRIAVEDSRLGIPLIFARDVIHGFKTVFPIPPGLASSFNPDLAEEMAKVSAMEASAAGVNWTFAPMIDICRDARWGRIAESLGEDPYLCTSLGVAMIKGYQGEKLSDKGSIAACVKHFAGYGAAEGGRDYNTALIPESELQNIYFPPFRAGIEAGSASLMSGFNDLNGVPVTGNTWLLRDILREEWDFKGVTVSDWESISQMEVHGYSSGQEESAQKALLAGVDMEMASTTYKDQIQKLLEIGKVDISLIDEAVRRILTLKYELGLFENPYTDPSEYPATGNSEYLDAAYRSTLESCVLLKNDNQTLPLQSNKIKNIAVIGPLANDRYEQLGTWIFDGDSLLSVTPLMALKELEGEGLSIKFEKALETSRAKTKDNFNKAITLVSEADVAILFLGEESILSGEAHSRGNLGLPGAQEDLLRAVKETGKPVITVIMAGRPLALGPVLAASDAVLYAWHPGTMGGPAIVDLIMGKVSPSGKLPLTFPVSSGQIPIYYNHKNSGKPPTPESFIHIDSIPVRAKQYSLGNTSHYIDLGYKALFPFGYGLTYTEFEYGETNLSSSEIGPGDSLNLSITLTNKGNFKATEIVQLYINDPVSSLTRPVRELKGFRRISLEPGESTKVNFTLGEEDLSAWYPDGGWKTEPGEFKAWISKDSDSGVPVSFTYEP